MTHTPSNIAEIYMREISRLHGIDKAIVSERDTKFTSKFGGDYLNDLVRI
jgi:hypothetical protein